MSEVTENVKGFEKVVGELQQLGRNVASYGLNMGKVVLETGAERLKSTADFLANMSDKLNAEAVEEATAESAQEGAEPAADKSN